MSETYYKSIIPKMDIGIIIALKQEFEEFHRQMETLLTIEQDRETKGSYYLFTYPNDNSQTSYKCVAAFAGKMGARAAGSLTERLIRKWNPLTIVNLGIAGGIKDVKLGDVVVATQVDSYIDRSKAVERKGGGRSKAKTEFDLFFGGEVYRPSSDLIQLAYNFQFTNTSLYKHWQGKCSTFLHERFNDEEYNELLNLGLLKKEINSTEGDIASGPIVSSSTAFIKKLLSRNRNFLCVEMEAGGIAAAVYEQVDPKKALVLRGISDYANEYKKKLDENYEDRLRTYAMHNALQLLLVYLEAGIFKRRKTRSSRSSLRPKTNSENTPSAQHRSNVVSVDESYFIRSPATKHFTGRRKELKRIKIKLRNSKVVAITALHGMPGVGKSTLANELAIELAGDFPAGILWVDFPSNQGNPLPILASWARLCGRPELAEIPSPDNRAQAIRRALETYIESRGQMLAVLDDVRQTDEDSWLNGAHLIRQAIPRNVPILITTRQESVAESLRAEDIIEIDALEPKDAVKLIRGLAPSITTKLAMELATLTGNLPLAIEIAVALSKTKGVEWVVKSLQDPETRVSTLDIDGTSRKEDSIRITFDLSYRSLSPHPAELFGLLGVFAQGFIDEEWILGFLRSYYKEFRIQYVDSIHKHVDELASKSLLQRTEKGYRFHPLLRDYARDFLRRSTKYDKAGLAHSEYFLKFVNKQENSSQNLGLALENVLQAFEFANQKGHWRSVIAFAQKIAMVGGYLHSHGHWLTAIKILNKAVEACDKLNEVKTKANLLCEIGIHQRESSLYDEAETTFLEAIRLGTKLQDDSILANASFNAGYIKLYKFNAEEATSLFNDAIIFSQRSSNQNALGEALRGLGRVKLFQGDLDTAEGYIRDSSTILERAGQRQGLAYSLRSLGEIYTEREDYETALGYFNRALEIAKAIKDMQAIAYIDRGLGDVYQRQGDYKKALNSYSESARLYRDVGDIAALSSALCCIGETYLFLSKPDKALAFFEEGYSLAGKIPGLARWQARNLFGLARIQEWKCDRNEALILARQALQLLTGRGHRDAKLIEVWLKELHIDEDEIN